jgi:hypothetical protein
MSHQNLTTSNSRDGFTCIISIIPMAYLVSIAIQSQVKVKAIAIYSL